MSIGVMHQGQVIYTDNLGARQESGVPDAWVSTSETVYNIGSISKSFAVAAIGRLFGGHGCVGWYTPVDEILESFRPADPRLRGLVAINGDFEFLPPREELLPTVGQLETIAPF
ncbi:hypothetical protein B0T25DRAFT_578815 [Lasiosphaeria hispida]|uniref:Beta-lactamase-related domain-containing protein n=1 Tax=Lasiosphaeria hispida TaxID=260671 RepID=A0AAJ0HL60_9PEZI|nr:hypothetical protein B0T25DRAFT_578815 [Lasiosphaeria hispida]